MSFTRSFILFQKYGYDNCAIVLLEKCECQCKDELRSREAHYIKLLKNINHNIPCQTLKQYYQTKKCDIKLYYEENKEKKLEYAKQYRLKKKANLLIQEALP